jgi:hypothetical protein
MTSTMSCPTRSFDDDTIQAYVAGKLPERETEAFELHLLGCGGCRQAVRLGAGIHGALGVPATARPRRARAMTAGAITLAAAVVMVALLSSRGGEGAGSFTPPKFSGFAVRGAADAETVRAMVDRGMAAYQRNDFAAAARILGEAARTDASPGVSFYLAAARLARGDVAGALDAARRASTPLDNPFAAEAAIIAAKAWLRLGRPDSAAAELQRAPRDQAGGAHAAALLDSLMRGRR